jgi:hypothetical protein
MTVLLHFDERGHLDEEGVALYVDALRLERTARLPEALRAHVAGCQQCRANVTGLFSLLAEEPLEASHPTLDNTASTWRIPPAAYRIAAMIVGAIGIVTVVYFYTKTERPVQESPQVATAVPRGTDSTSAASVARVERAASQEIAANFRPYEELEGLVGSELRGESFEVTSPGELSDRRAITFSWKTAGSGPWKIVVLDNRGGIVEEAEVRSVPFVLNGPFRPGLYYWKVIQNDELAHVGKFRAE